MDDSRQQGHQEVSAGCASLVLAVVLARALPVFGDAVTTK
jgi:hypothetical protein